MVSGNMTLKGREKTPHLLKKTKHQNNEFINVSIYKTHTNNPLGL